MPTQRPVLYLLAAVVALTLSACSVPESSENASQESVSTLSVQEDSSVDSSPITPDIVGFTTEPDQDFCTIWPETASCAAPKEVTPTPNQTPATIKSKTTPKTAPKRTAPKPIITPNPTVQPTSNNQQTSESSEPTYTQGVCTKTALKPDTKHQNAAWLNVGETSTREGIDGVEVKCTPDSNGKDNSYRISAIPTMVYVGTATPAPAPMVAPVPVLTPIPTGLSQAEREEKTRQCIEYIKRVSPGSSAWQQC